MEDLVHDATKDAHAVLLYVVGPSALDGPTVGHKNVSAPEQPIMMGVGTIKRTVSQRERCKMKTSLITTLSAAALALTGCGSKESATQEANTSVAANTVAAPAPAAPISNGQMFANEAAASDAFEIESSRLALASSSSAAVKKFAQSMIDAHTASTDKLKTAATAATPAITPDPALTPEQQAKLTSLKQTNGTAFDQAYVAAQVEGHQKTLDMLRAYSTSGEVAELKAFATTLAPTVAAHLNMAKAIKI